MIQIFNKRIRQTVFAISEITKRKKLLLILPICAIFCMAVSLQAQTPGGVNSANYQWVAWLTPDGYASGTWTNRITNQLSVGNFRSVAQKGNTTPVVAPIMVNTGYNFHPSVRFSKPSGASGGSNDASRLVSQTSLNVSNRNVVIFIVYKRNNNTAWENIFTFNADNDGNIGWYTSNNQGLRWYWQNNPNVNVVTAQEGIIALDNANIASNGLNAYLEGNAVLTGQTKGTRTYNSQLAIATNGSSGYGFDGTIQEIIVLSAGASGSFIAPADLLQIHSYLAIKYGTTLNNTNHYIIAGDTVWNRNANNNYNNHIFGIVRDSRTSLTQVQSISRSNTTLALYKGSWNTLNDNNSQQLTDGTYVMVGSNNQSGQRLYEMNKHTVNPGTNSPLGENLNFRTERIYKIQVTGGSLPNKGETVNMRMNSISPNAKFVMVSNTASFDTNHTRYYPITQLQPTVYNANNVTVYDGDFISFAGFEPTPGGIDMTGSQLDVWIDGDNSTNNSWTPLAFSSFQVEQVSTAPTPTVQNSTKFNFHRELNFGNGNRKLRTATTYNLQVGQSYQMFIVSDATVGNLGTNYAVLLTCYNSNSETSIRWSGRTQNNSNVLSANWSTTEQCTGSFPAASNLRYGIASLNVRNANSSSNNELYLNGKRGTFGLQTGSNGNGPSNRNTNVQFGNTNNSTAAGTEPFNGTIQEIIMIRRSAGQLMPEADIQQIHSYLAIKYGITLSSIYRNSNGDTVWNINANAPYNQNIIGVARDDNSGLYQKQGRSANFRYFTAFVGNDIETLNSQNNGTLEDRQYLMIGQNSNTIIKTLQGSETTRFVDSAVFMNDTLFAPAGINIKSGTFKTQLTGMDSININLQAPTADFSYILISTTDTFGLAETKIYKLDRRVINVRLDTAYRYFVFIGFAPGPAGISKGLKLWLRADDEASLIITNKDIADEGLRTGTGTTLNTAYPNKYGLDPSNLPVVEEWKDLPRSHTYSALPKSIANGTNPSANGERYPIFHPNRPEMNFHPSVEFWSRTRDLGGEASSAQCGTNDAAAFFSNKSNLLPQTLNQHLLILLTNNDFTSNPWVFPFGFHPTGESDQDYNGPAYGVRRDGDSGKGRIRFSSGTVIDGSKRMFSPGATTILMFDHNSVSSNTQEITWRFNARKETMRATSSLTAMNRPTLLGSPFRAADRTIQGFMGEAIFYDASQLLEADKEKIESYLAIKYGITLYPDSNRYQHGRFNYKFSNDTVFWEGNNPTTNKYARFYNRIAAIIRDDAAHLENEQSHSTNVGSILRMGIAGSVLTNDGESLGHLEQNLTAIVWGDDNNTGLELINEDPCGTYDTIFRRIWLIHKTTTAPLRMLVAAENNNGLTIGDDPATIPYYNKLTEGYNVTMIVADRPEDLTAASFNPKAVIPMTHIHNLHQCNYVFNDSCTYITFAVKSNGKGCDVGTDETAFNGLRTFDWQRFTNTINRSGNHVARVPALNSIHANVSNGMVWTNVGDNIRVNTWVEFGNPTKAGTGFPSTGNTPVKGTLQVRRSGTAPTLWQDVTIRMQFRSQTNNSLAYPVIPSFTISGIDGAWQSFDSVVIEGMCQSEAFRPILSYASGPNRNTAYRINGNSATAILNNIMAATNLNGRLNVEFENGITDITIKYRLRNRVYGTQSIFISPINMRALLPPPPFDEAGISFVQTAMPQEVSICKEVTYTWRIQNVNCTPKTVNFSAGLPNHMRWIDESLGLDSSYIGNTTVIHPYGEIDSLIIDSLVIPSGTTAVFRAVAHFDENAPAGIYSNRAMLKYSLIVQNIMTEKINTSCDGLTMGCEPTNITALEGVILKKLEIVDFNIDKECYSAGDTVTMRLKINNPNSIPLENAALEIFYNDEFRYVRNSLNSGNITGGNAINTDDYDDVMIIEDVQNNGGKLAIDTADGTTEALIFLAQPIPSDTSVITFKLLAPNVLTQEVADTGLVFDESHSPAFTNLNIAFDFFSMSDEDCAATVFYNAYGEGSVPALPAVSIFTKHQICIGDTTQLSRWQGGTWESSNTNVATVNPQTGKVTAVGSGKAVFYFTVENSSCRTETSDTLTVWNKALLTSDTAVEVCTGFPLDYTVASNEAGATYSWSREAVNGISNPAQTQTVPSSNVNINETLNLTNQSGSAIVVDYTIYIHAHGCVDECKLHVTVKPREKPTVKIRRRQ